MGGVGVGGLGVICVGCIYGFVNEYWIGMIRIFSCVEKFHEFREAIGAIRPRFQLPSGTSNFEEDVRSGCVCCYSGK